MGCHYFLWWISYLLHQSTSLPFICTKLCWLVTVADGHVLLEFSLLLSFIYRVYAKQQPWDMSSLCTAYIHIKEWTNKTTNSNQDNNQTSYPHAPTQLTNSADASRGHVTRCQSQNVTVTEANTCSRNRLYTVKTRSSAYAKRTARPLQKYQRKTENIWELHLWWALANPSCVLNLKSLASALCKYWSETTKFWRAPLAQGHAHLSYGCDFIMGFGKPELCTKFEVVSFSQSVNNEGKPQI